jgi:hypothetical protein
MPPEGPLTVYTKRGILRALESLHLGLYTAGPGNLFCSATPELCVQKINVASNVRSGTNASNLEHRRMIVISRALITNVIPRPKLTVP